MGYFKKGSKIISVEQMDGFGKRPGLWIGNVGQLVKVASFNSFEHASLFEEWLTSFLRELIAEEDDGK